MSHHHNDHSHDPGHNDAKLEVERLIDATPKDIFDVLTLPDNHAKLDGAGFVQSVAKGDRITEVGQVFTMNMGGGHPLGEFKTDNHVSAYVPNKMVGWKTAPEGQEPAGWEWLWVLEAEEQGRETKVTLVYDWSKVTDKEVLKMVSFPLIAKEQLEHSLALLAAAVV